MRALLKPLAVGVLRRDPGEIVERSRNFRIEREHGRTLVRSLGEAFLGGYNAMLESVTLENVTAQGTAVPKHYRPFYFEGAAMGYLPRCLYTADCRPAHAERDLLGMQPAFRYLYYVGLGFWYGFRHRRRPERLLALEPHIDPLFFPLCFDGFGFKLGFFDYPGKPEAAGILSRCPETYAPQAWQGYGRSMFFVFMDDEKGWRALRREMPDQHQWDLEFGRSLACGFTGADRPDSLADYIEAAADPAEKSARLTGVTWALTARRMNDPAYFATCMARASGPTRARLEPLPDVCDGLLEGASSYTVWQTTTRDAVLSTAA